MTKFQVAIASYTMVQIIFVVVYYITSKPWEIFAYYSIVGFLALIITLMLKEKK